MAQAVQSVRASGQWMSGGNIAQNARNLLFRGFSLQANSSDFGTPDYVVLDTDGFSWELQPTYHIEMQTDMVRFLGRHIHFPPGGPPETDSSCWFTHGIICRGGECVWTWFFGFVRIETHAFYVRSNYYLLCYRCESFRHGFNLPVWFSVHLLLNWLLLLHQVFIKL